MIDEMKVTAAFPGFYLISVSYGVEKGPAQSIYLEPIIAWGHVIRNRPSSAGDEFYNAEPIGLDGGYSSSKGILTPNGLVIQVGNKTWATLAEFMNEEFGRALPVHGGRYAGSV